MPVFVKIVVLLLFVFVVVSLFRALFNLMKGDKEHSKKAVKALSWRVGLSLLIFVFLMASERMGWVEPHPVNPTKKGFSLLGESVEPVSTEESTNAAE